MNVRQRDRWVEDGNDAGVDGPGVVAVEPGREWNLLLAVDGVSHEIVKIRRNVGNCRHGAVSRIEGGRIGKRRGRARLARLLLPIPREQGSQPLFTCG